MDAAVYTAATRFLVVGQFVNMALVAPAQPRLSALLAARDIAGTRELFQTTTSWLCRETQAQLPAFMAGELHGDVRDP